MSTQVSRREFFQTGAGLTAGGVLFSTQSAYGFDLRPAAAQVSELKISRTTQTHSVCPYCAVGCGVVIHTLGDRSENVKPTVVHIEGDPENPINEGTLCPKGISLKQFIVNDDRLTEPKYRAPGSNEWSPISWPDAIERMAQRIKASRDAAFQVNDDQGRLVNRLDRVGLIGGCTDTNEINYLLGKLRFALGITCYENQARL